MRSASAKPPCRPAFSGAGQVLVDTHAQLDWAERIRASRFIFAADLDTVYRACRRVAWDGLDLLCLGKYDQVIYLTVHAINHNLGTLDLVGRHPAPGGRLADPGLEQLRRRARDSSGRSGSWWFSHLCGRRFLEFDPVAAFAGLNLSALARSFCGCAKRGPLPRRSSLTLLSTGNRFHRLEFAFESTFPRPEVLRQVFADRHEQSDRALYGLRIRQLLGMIKSQGFNGARFTVQRLKSE